MNAYDKILIGVFFFAVIVWQALHQAHLFKQNKTISHFWKGVAYVGAIVLITVPYVSAYNWWYLLKIPALGVLERMAFFDFTLNLAHNDPLFYNGPKVTEAKSKGSWVDKLENKLSESWLRVLKITYVILFIIAIILIK